MEKKISPPPNKNGVIPEIVIDVTNDAILINNRLGPEQVAREVFEITSGSDHGDYWFAKDLQGGEALGLLLFYMDAFRTSYRLHGATEGTPIEQMWRSGTDPQPTSEESSAEEEVDDSNSSESGNEESPDIVETAEPSTEEDSES